MACARLRVSFSAALLRMKGGGIGAESMASGNLAWDVGQGGSRERSEVGTGR